MASLKRSVMASAVRGLIDTARFDEAVQLLDFFGGLLAETDSGQFEIERLRLEVQLNVGDIDGAASALQDMVLKQDSTEAAKVLLNHLVHRGRTEQAEKICRHVVDRIDAHLTSVADSERRRALGAGLRYFLDRWLKFATINRRPREQIDALKKRLQPFVLGAAEDHISTLRERDLLDPQDVRKPRWHVEQEVDYFPEYFSRTIDFEDAIRGFLLKKHLRKTIEISPSDEILTYGSCFASNLRLGLKRRGYPADNIDIPEGLNNSFALLQYFRWAITGKSIGEAAYDAAGIGSVEK